MNFADYQNHYNPLIEESLKSQLQRFQFGKSQNLMRMLTYHLGWDDNGIHGKRLRPLITLLCTQALGGNTQSAMPAATAIELLHNFTLIHDDIEDRSPMRHGRKTLWKRWGEAQAINAGDALFSIAQLSILDLKESVGFKAAIKAARYFNQTCLQLTQGQYLDIALENECETTLDTYLEMIQGKTGALIAFSAAVSGVIAGTDQTNIGLLKTFGESLGIAFQIQDDFLGIWGDPDITGKSAVSDILAKKKSLPVLFGLQNCDEFRRLWSKGDVNPEQVKRMAGILETCGAKAYVRNSAEQYTVKAFRALKNLFPSNAQENEPAEALFELTEDLLGREF
ncbi:MAG: polyprenyl synthetase family protein [Brevefilum sp.]